MGQKGGGVKRMEKIQTFLDLIITLLVSAWMMHDIQASGELWILGGGEIFCRSILNVQAIHSQELQPQGRKDGLLTYKSNQKYLQENWKGVIVRQTGVHRQREHTVPHNMIRRTFAAHYSHM